MHRRHAVHVEGAELGEGLLVKGVEHADLWRGGGSGCLCAAAGFADVDDELGHEIFGAGDDAARDAGEAGDVDAVGFVGLAGGDAVHEDDFVLPLADEDVVVGDGGRGFGEFGQFVVVRREEGAALRGVGEEFRDGPGEGEAVEGGGAAADFVEDDEGFFACVVEDVGGLDHFDHEGGLALGEVVRGADAGEDAVDNANGGALGGDKGAGLGEEGEEGDLADVGGFAGHVWAGD